MAHQHRHSVCLRKHRGTCSYYLVQIFFTREVSHSSLRHVSAAYVMPAIAILSELPYLTKPSGKKKLTIWKWFAGVMKESGAGARRKGGRAITQWEVGGTMRGKVERAQILRITQSKTCFSSTCSQYCL